MNILLYRPVQLDPLDLQHFDFLDPWGKNQPETANKNLFLSKPKSKLKKEISKVPSSLNGSSSLADINKKIRKYFENYFSAKKKSANPKKVS